MKRSKLCLIAAFFIFALISSVAGCGGGLTGNTGANTGAVSVQVQWPNSLNTSRAGVGSVKTAPAGVTTVRIIVSAPGMTAIQQDFTASANSGTVDNIPAGSNRTITAEGLDANGNITCQGSVGNITITAGQTTDAGIITLLINSILGSGQ